MKAIFFDRDGVLVNLNKNDPSRGPRNLRELELAPKAVDVVFELSGNGYHCELISNQPDFARGYLTPKDHEEIKEFIDYIFQGKLVQRYCLHDSNNRCRCRKPEPGMLQTAMKEFLIEPSSSFLIGDRWIDILTAKNFGCKSILLENKFSWRPTSQGSPPASLKPNFFVDELENVIPIINLS